MKKLFVVFCCFFALALVGCDVNREVLGAYVSKVNPDWHETGIFKVSFSEDETLKNKYVDIWIKTPNDNTSLMIGEEMNGPVEINMALGGVWYSLTTLIDSANGLHNMEDYVKYSEAVLRTFLVTSDAEVTLIIKVVAGDREKNFTETGYLLTNRRDVSKEIELKVGSDAS